MNVRRAIAFMIVGLYYCSPARAQSLPASTQAQVVPDPVVPSAPEPQRETMGLQLSLSIAKGTFSLEMKGSRSLPFTPDPLAYDDGEAVSGTYEDGGLEQSRAVASIGFPGEQRVFLLGLGLERIESGRDKQKLVKTGGTQGFFQLNSLLFELGAQRRLERWGLVDVNLGLAHGLEGKLQSRYRSPGTLESQLRLIPISDRVKGSERLTIGGGYHFFIAPACALGLRLELAYGIITFLERSEISKLFSSSLGIELTLKI